jgi:hypothetical protein
MTLTDLINEVYTITARPDRVAETLSGIKSATLKAHQCDFFYKDMFEVGIAFTTSDYVQQIDYRSLIPLWRANKYLRKYDATSGTPGRFLELIQPEQILDRYTVEKTNIYYTAGSFINVKSDTQEQYYLYGCYVNPDVTSTGYNSWVAKDHPYAIVFDAAATVFKAIGKDDEAAAYRNLVGEQLAMVKESNIISQGY